MRITDTESQRQVQVLELCLTQAEARELRDALDALLRDSSARHEHVSSSDYQTDLTVWIGDDPDVGSGGPST